MKRLRPIRISGRALPLIELLLLIAVLGTMSALAILNFVNMLDNARIKRARADMKIIGRTLIDHLLDSGVLPVDLSSFSVMMRVAPWRNPCQYVVVPGKQKTEVHSYANHKVVRNKLPESDRVFYTVVYQYDIRQKFEFPF